MNRFREFESKLSYAAFTSIKDRVKFIDYEKLAAYHAKVFELQEIQKALTL